MSVPLLLPMPGNEKMATSLAGRLGAETADLATRKFPDGETYLRIEGNVKDRPIAIVCTLDRPDAKLLPLIFAADTARELGASRVGLIAPYLAYMRQDRRFQQGEAVTSHSFARLLSVTFDWLVTVDPHLHRYKALDEIFAIPAKTVHAAPLVAEWIGKNVANPILIGPDSESVQWVADIAARVGAPCLVLNKIRKADRQVEVRLAGGGDAIAGRTPVLVDDIVSSGRTMLEAVKLIKGASAKPVCIAVHGIFADGSDSALARQGAHVVSCNTIAHATNAIDVSALLVEGARDLLRGA